MTERTLITVQVFVDADPREAENVAVRATDYILESFADQVAAVQTCHVATKPFVFGPFAASGVLFTNDSA